MRIEKRIEACVWHWAETTPEAIAITDQGQAITYRELASRAANLCERLLRCGAGPEVLIALSAERSAGLIAGLIAILRSGAAYVPIDPSYPADRRAFLLEDSQCPIIVTETRHLAAFSSHTGSVIVIDDASADRIVPPRFVSVVDVEDPLAYIIYTSGSTGKPKGVEIKRSNVLWLFESTDPWFHFTNSDVWTFFHSYAFDFSVFEIWGALRYGGRLVIVPHEISRDPIAFRSLVRSERVTVLCQTPSAFRVFQAADALLRPANADALRYVVFGGEALDLRLLASWFDRYGDTSPLLINMLGTTETTVHATYRVIHREDATDPRSLIGEPLSGLTIELRNDQGALVNQGHEGEIWIGGAGVGRGYFRRPELSAERFIGGFYRTGDLGRLCPDGELEYLGRIDHQVKLRGFRIELGEIEAVLRSAEGVAGAVVELRNDLPGDPALVGYIVPAAHLANLTAIAAHVRLALPEYMCPTHLVQLEALPLTLHGKLDRRALPLPAALKSEVSNLAGSSTAGRVAALYREVLGIAAVSGESNFFGLGGTSLQAMMLALKIAGEFQVSLPPGSVFRHPDVASLASAIDTAGSDNQSASDDSVDANLWQPLSIAQEQLWLVQRMNPTSNALHCPVAYRITGTLDTARLAAAVDHACRRHAALRTIFGIHEGKPVQKVEAQPTFRLLLKHQDDSLDALIAEPLDLEQSSGTAALFPISEHEHIFVLNLHHVITDGWSMARLMDEIVTWYSGGSVATPAAQFLDLAAAHRRRVESGELASSALFWKQEFAGAPAVTGIPLDYPRPAHSSFRRGSIAFDISSDLGGRLAAAAQAAQSTVNSLILATFAALIQRYTHQEDLVFGMPYGGRDEPGSEDVQGLFMNLLAVRVRLEQGVTFRTLARRVAASSLASYGHSAFPFSWLVRDLGVKRESNRQPLVQIVFAPQAAPRDPLSAAGLTLHPIDVPLDTTFYDLTLCTWPSGAGFQAELIYAADIFSEERMAALRDHFLRLLDQCLVEPDQPVNGLDIFSGEERQRLSRDWSGRAQADHWNAQLHPGFLDVFARLAVEIPDNKAIIYGGQTVTYRELDAWSNGIAHALIARGAGAEAIVAVCCQRSAAAMAAILGTWKAGAAYLPLDPTYPVDRLSWLLSDSGASLIITAGVSFPAATKLDCLDVLDPVLNKTTTRVQTTPGPDTLAYVIYTSGSTGTPKGVMMEHKGVTALTAAILETYPLPRGARLLQFVPLAFDVSVAELIFAFAQGATMVIPAHSQVLAGAELLDFLETAEISQILLPASVLSQLEPRPLPHLMRLISGGERCPAMVADRWSVGRELCNAYGPTEAGVGAAIHRCAPGEGDPPIGRPLPGWTLYVLDAEQRLVPCGIPGELYIGGPGVARGYLGLPESTREKFLDTGVPGIPERLYRSGDLVRWRGDGALEFVGRVDDQYKVRGFRIEPGEIEAALRGHPQVQAAAAIVMGDGAMARIVAYVTPQSADVDQIQLSLRGTLPAQLVPSAIVALAELPLTSNGKVDRAALAHLTIAPRQSPVDRTETPVTTIWRELLGRPIAATENFFDAGGTSLLLVEVQIRLEALTGTRVALAELFAYPTINAMNRLFAAQAPAAVKVGHLPIQSSGQIAIVGMAARFPQSPDIASYWRNLCEGRDCITRFSVNELIDAGVPALLAHSPDYVRARGVIEGDDKFDAALFEIGAHEAERIDPQQRIWLETALTALEDAGCDPHTFAGSIGVFAGAGAPEYWLQWPNRDDYQIGLGSDKDFIATRTSYKLGLRGPSLTVQTACSTSLVAVSLACQQLLAGECDAAIAGAVSLSIPSRSGYLYQQGMILSPDGCCRPFDSKAQGTVPGDGAGAVVLKRLSDAVANGDDIYAVITGAAVNNDGSDKVGYTAPGIAGQKQVIATAWARAGVSGRDIGFVEAHGTATPMGDPIEFSVLRQLFEESGAEPGACALGSVKSNVGHLNAAAGIAGLIKAALALKHRNIPATLHFENPNPEMNLEGSPFYVNTSQRPWLSPLTTASTARMAGVSSFGIGGTNAHIVLSEAPPRLEPARPEDAELLPMSAATPTALALIASRLADHLAKPGASLASVARTLQTGRTARRVRLAIVASTIGQAIERLRKPAATTADEEHSLRALGESWCAGGDVDWTDLRGSNRAGLTHLPAYPFERKRYWGLPTAGLSAPARVVSEESGWVYVPTWIEAPVLEAERPSSRWVVFVDKGGRAAALVNDLGPQTVVVHAGLRFERLGAREFTINPASRGDMAAVIEATRDDSPVAFLHCFSLDSACSLESLDSALARGYTSVVAMLQAVASSSVTAPRITVVTSEGLTTTGGNPLAAAIGGLMRVAVEEYPAIKCRHIDLDSGELPRSELDASPSAAAIALRGGRRLVCSYQPAPAVSAPAIRLRDNGVYLITGGLGGIGLTLAEHLATKYCARLMLASRNGLPVRGEDEETRHRLAAFERIRAAAGGLIVVSADIGDVCQARELVQRTIAEFGCLDGVIHAAGITGGGALQRRSQQTADDIFHSKVRGTLALDAALRDVPHQFLFLCSSLTAVGATYGQADYTAANAFLDAFAECSDTPQRRVVSVNWDGWSEVGAHARHAAASTATAFAHPMLNGWEPDSQGGTYRTDLDSHHWLVAEHIVAGEPMVPGTTYMELACAAAQAEGMAFPFGIRELTIVAPCTVPRGGTHALYTAVEKTGSGLELRMESREPGGGRQLHALARVVECMIPREAADPAMGALPSPTGDGVRPDRHGFIEFGPRWACPAWQDSAEGRQLGACRLPDAFAGEAATFTLHPALFDVLSGVAAPPQDGAYLPFAYSDVVVYAPLGADVRLTASSTSASHESLHLAMRISDPQGNLLVSVGDYTLRQISVAMEAR